MRSAALSETIVSHVCGAETVSGFDAEFLDFGDLSFMWGRAAVICPHLGRSGGIRLPRCRPCTAMRREGGRQCARTPSCDRTRACAIPVTPAGSRWPLSRRATERDDHFAHAQWRSLRRRPPHCRSVRGEGLDDIDLVEATLRRCVDAARANSLHIHVHHFQPNGISGVAVLAESHISIHTWPDASYAALDVFMCGKANPDACIPVLREAFQAARVEVNEILRGQESLTTTAMGGGGRERIIAGFSLSSSPPDTVAAKRWIAETLFDDLGFRMTYAAERGALRGADRAPASCPV